MESSGNFVEQLEAKSNQLLRLLNDEASADVRRQTASAEARWQSLVNQRQKLHQHLNDAAKQQHHMLLVAIQSKLSKARELLNTDVEFNPDAVHSHHNQLEVDLQRLTFFLFISFDQLLLLNPVTCSCLRSLNC
jgi:hypothetical protein